MQQINPMKNFFLPLLLFFSVFMISSCDPLTDQNGDLLVGLNETPTTGGSNETPRVLKKMFSHSKNDETGDWEDVTTIFNYTNNKLTSVTDDSGTNMQIEYNGSNKISKVFSGTELTSNFEYSGANVSKITTTITGMTKMVAKFTYNGTKIIKSEIDTELLFMPIPTKTYTEDVYEYQGENVSKITTKMGAYDPISGDLEMAPVPAVSTYQYDAKNSAYPLLPKEFWMFFSSIAPQTGSFYSKNNPLKVIVVDETGTDTQTITYEYDNKNYVTKGTSGEAYGTYHYQ